jgi:uncharacterized protein (DUF488 family)
MVSMRSIGPDSKVKTRPNRRKIRRARIFTIGHSNRSIHEFIEMLNAYKLRLLIDVRTIPKSRHNPQFGSGRLKRTLSKHGIEYVHMGGLGGLRKPNKNSINSAWRNASFRGYADYMQTVEFREALQMLIGKSKRKRLVMMCAEAVPWRCHRSLIGDALLARGIEVEDIMSKSSHRPHRMTPFAKRRGARISYPA